MTKPLVKISQGFQTSNELLKIFKGFIEEFLREYIKKMSVQNKLSDQTVSRLNESGMKIKNIVFNY